MESPGPTLKLAPQDRLQTDPITCMQALGGLNLEVQLPSISPCQQDGDQPLKLDTLKALYIFLGAEECLHRSILGRQKM